MICVLCEAEETEQPQVCDNCIRRGDWTLGAIADHYVLLRAPDPTPDRRLYAVRDPDTGRKTGERHPNDPIAAILPAGLTKSGSRIPVSGSREAPLPLNEDNLDLSMPVRQASVRDTLVPKTVTTEEQILVRRTGWHRGTPLAPDELERGIPQAVEELVTVRQRRIARDTKGQPIMEAAGDQIGHLSAASILDGWVRDWRDYRDAREGNPVPTVLSLAQWLRDRWPWACEHHPALADFTAETGALLGALKAATKDTAQRPELCEGVACGRPECDERNLYRVDGYVECYSCGTLYKPTEFDELAREQAKTVKTRRAA